MKNFFLKESPFTLWEYIIVLLLTALITTLIVNYLHKPLTTPTLTMTYLREGDDTIRTIQIKGECITTEDTYEKCLPAVKGDIESFSLYASQQSFISFTRK